MTAAEENNMLSKQRKDLVTLADVTRSEMEAWFRLALNLKKEQKSGKKHHLLLAGKILAMIFQKPSTRTRVSFESGMAQLGGAALYLSSSDIQIGRGETIADTARVLSRYVDVIMARVYAHGDIEELARSATVPVINGLSDFSHPCQALADYLTIWEKKKNLKGLLLVYVGDGNNVAHSLIYAGAKLGVSVVCVTPPGYEPSSRVVEAARADAAKNGSRVIVTNDVKEGVRGADIIYTDVWASMGQEAQHEKRVKLFAPYQVNERLMGLTGKDDTIFMHCLPAHRGEEVSNGVMEGPASVVFDQAENRLHIQKAVLVSLVSVKKKSGRANLNKRLVHAS